MQNHKMKTTRAALVKFLFSCELTDCMIRNRLGGGNGMHDNKLMGAFLRNRRLKRRGEFNTKEPGLKRKSRNMEKKKFYV